MVPWKVILSIILLFLSVCNCQDFGPEPDLISNHTAGTFDNNRTSFEYSFTLKKVVTDPLAASLRIETEVVPNGKATVNCPIIFIVQQGETVVSFHFPRNITYDGKASYIHYGGARTLCFSQHEDQNDIKMVRVTVSTCSPTGATFNFNLTGSSNALLQTEQKMTASITPTSPAYFPYRFDPRRAKGIVLVEVTSEDNICMTVSVQSAQCPVADQEDTVNFKGKGRNYWQTMSTVSLMPITRDSFPNGFILVFVVNTDDAKCKEYRGINPSISEYSDERTGTFQADPKLKTIKFVVNEDLPHGEYIYPVFVPLAFYIGLMGFVLFLFTIFYQCTICCMKRRVPELPPFQVQYTNSNRTLNVSTLPVDTGSLRSRSSIDSTASSNASRFSPTPIESDEIRILRSRYNPGDSQSRAGQPPCVTDLVYAPSKYIETSRRYYWLMFTIAIFYSVPVFQLLATYQQILQRTGDNDLCYYNYHCAHPLWNVVDFNHIYSNIGYILLGTFFMFLVYFKDRLHQQIIENIRRANNLELPPSMSTSPIVRQPEERYGTIQHFGIYYSLGFALIMEGVLSAGYHVCPNRSNFQFDTSFMYVMAVLCMVKIYQFRHPVRINASTTFAVLAVIAVISVLGLLVAQLTVAIIFALVHLFAVFCIQIYMYYVGFITDEEDGTLVTSHFKLLKLVSRKWQHIYETEKWFRWFLPKHLSRVLLPILIIPFNLGVTIFHFVESTNFASHLLYIFIGNLLLYLTYYMIMKILHGEFMHAKTIQPLIYIPLTVILWSYALTYFARNLTSWEKSPAESRQQNEECFLMEFYDFHDMWHFLSAGALFCSFMMLLTLEDALAERPQRLIPVF